MERILSEKRAPSAKELSILFGPSLILSTVLVAGQVYNGDQDFIKPVYPVADSHILTLSDEQLIGTSFAKDPVQKLLIEDRTDCDQIYGTDYRSQSEREYYLEVCNTPEAVKGHIVQWLKEADWPQELIDDAIDVSWGCESGGDPNVVSEDGQSFGLFQLDRMWFIYAGEDPQKWADPIVNAKVALKVYYYDIERGQRPWTQWGCKPESLTSR